MTTEHTRVSRSFPVEDHRRDNLLASCRQAMSFTELIRPYERISRLLSACVSPTKRAFAAEPFTVNLAPGEALVSNLPTSNRRQGMSIAFLLSVGLDGNHTGKPQHEGFMQKSISRSLLHDFQTC